MNLLSFLLGLIIHSVAPSRLVDGGELRISTHEVNSSEIRVEINYFLDMSWYSPVGDQRGTLTQSLPEEYIREEGYLRLESRGWEDYQDVRLTHLGRTACLGFPDCHAIRVTKHDGSWEAVAHYHPSVPSTGWAHLALTYKRIPAIGDYTVHTNLRR